jgi:hypothetical protein
VTPGTISAMSGRLFVQQLAWQELAALVTSALLLVMLVLPVPSILTFVVAVLFVVCGPGTALLAVTGSPYFGPDHSGLIAALGLAQIVLFGEVLLWVHAFYPRPELAIAAAAVVATVTLTAWRSARGELPNDAAVHDGSPGDTGAADTAVPVDVDAQDVHPHGGEL